MRIKTTRLAMKKAVDEAKNKSKWNNESEFIGNKSRIVNIADLGN